MNRYNPVVTTFDELRLGSFAAGEPPASGVPLRLRVRRLEGGYVSRGVARVSARVADRSQTLRHRDFVVNHLSGLERREIAVYQALDEHGLVLAPRFLGAESVGPGDAYLYLEPIPRRPSWPWKDPGLAGLVLEELAKLHTLVPSEAAPPDWNYDSELERSAASTLELVEHAATRQGYDWARHGVRHVRTVAREIRAIRQELVRRDRAFIHGDVHPGNVRLWVWQGRERVVLLDWSRARSGSPLEDVSSWLQSLGFWEERARQRHDTLLRRYLMARGISLSRTLRTAYWLAGACNALAGALRYHVWRAVDEAGATPLQRARGASAARDWLRIVRRGAESWRKLQRESAGPS